ncbi:MULTISPECIES: hypothetical protein [unclassified Pseudomonas]|uniref:hypothetical protein n=1 Tax=unclassified Pseudomonas TaxID=196821 RepID=UPI0031DC68FA
MDFPEITAILGAIVSLVAAFISFKATKSRVQIERELQQELHSKLMQDSFLLKHLTDAETDEDIKHEVQTHHDIYFAMISSAMNELPPEKRNEVYKALSQRSKRGSTTYMSKLLKSSMKTFGIIH